MIHVDTLLGLLFVWNLFLAMLVDRWFSKQAKGLTTL